MTIEEALTRELHRRGLSTPMPANVSGHDGYVALVNDHRVLYLLFDGIAGRALDDPESAVERALEMAERHGYLCRVRITSADGIAFKVATEPRDDAISQALASGNPRVALDDAAVRRQEYAWEEEDGHFVERFEREMPGEICRVRGRHDWMQVGLDEGAVCRVCKAKQGEGGA